MKLNAERLREYQIKHGAHKSKNRSSKHLRRIGGMKSIFKSMSNEMLQKLSSKDCFDASYELNRRDNVRDRNALRQERYRAKIAAKRAAKAEAGSEK